MHQTHLHSNKNQIALFQQEVYEIETTNTSNGHVPQQSMISNGSHSHSHQGVNGVNGDISNGVYPSTPPPPFPPVGRKRDVYLDATVFHSIDQIAISVS